MEEGQNQQPQETSFPQGQSSGVSFPTVNQPKKSGGAKTLLIVGILILVGILGFVIYKSASKSANTITTEPTPFDNLTAPSTQDQSVSIATPEPTSTPAASVKKADIKVQVQNGTGIAGEAAYLQTQLEGLGYTNIKVGNAATSGATDTTVTFSSSLDSGVVSEITQKLKSIYQNVTTTNSTTVTFDVVVVTGLRKGATPIASSTPSPSPTP